MTHLNVCAATGDDDRVRSSAVHGFRSIDGASAPDSSPQEIFFQALCDIEFDICEDFAPPHHRLLPRQRQFIRTGIGAVRSRGPLARGGRSVTRRLTQLLHRRIRGWPEWPGA